MPKRIAKHAHKHFKKHNYVIGQTLRWALFIVAALTMSVKIAQVSAYETTLILLETPELAEKSILVQHGYLIFR